MEAGKWALLLNVSLMAGKHAVKRPPGKDWQTRAEIQVRGVVTSVLGKIVHVSTPRGGALISPLAAWEYSKTGYAR